MQKKFQEKFVSVSICFLIYGKTWNICGKAIQQVEVYGMGPFIESTKMAVSSRGDGLATSDSIEGEQPHTPLLMGVRVLLA